MSNGTIALPGAFRAPRVPFDLKSLILATAGFLAMFVVNLGLEKILDQPNPVGQMVSLLAREIGQIAFLGEGFSRAMEGIWGIPPYALTFWESALTGFVFFSLWGVFGGAVLRTASMRLTRDEPVTLRDALLFGVKNLRALLLAPILVVAVAGVFCLCNAVAGFLMTIPVFGSTILTIVLFPLVLLSSLLVILTVLAGVIGLPLMWAGIAFEQNGALEALSRTFSYVFARPLQFFFGYLLIFVFMSAIVLVGSFFEDTTKRTVRAWSWRSDFKELISGSVPQVADQQERMSEKWTERVQGIGNLRNIDNAPWTDVVGFFAMWLFLSAFLLAFKGYALYLFLGGTASIYLLLRKEVDGTEEDEIFVPESAPAAAAAEPKWVGGAKPEGVQPSPSDGGAAPAP